MAKIFTGTYSCGHNGEIEVLGGNRQMKADRHFSGICLECWLKKREEEKNGAVVTAKEYGFPELTGSEKQIKWANEIRAKFYEEPRDFRDTEIDEVIYRETTAKFWIDNRNECNNSHFTREYYSTLIQSKQ